MRRHVVPELAGAAAGDEQPLEFGSRRLGERAALQRAEIHLQPVRRGGGYALARAVQLRAEHAVAVEYAAGGDDLCQLVLVAEAVHQRDEHRVLADAGSGGFERGVELRCLGHEDDDVHCADILGVIGRFEAGELIGLSLSGVDDEGETVGGNFVHVLLVRVDERYVRAAAPQIGRKNAAGSAGAYHCDFHMRHSFLEL